MRKRGGQIVVLTRERRGAFRLIGDRSQVWLAIIVVLGINILGDWFIFAAIAKRVAFRYKFIVTLKSLHVVVAMRDSLHDRHLAVGRQGFLVRASQPFLCIGVLG